MTLLELKEKRMDVKTQLDELLKKGEAEARCLNDEEQTSMKEYIRQMDELDAQIAEEEKRNIEINKENKENKETNKMAKQFRLFDAIKGIAEGNVSEEMRSAGVINGNKIDYRAIIQAGQAGAGQENVPEDKKDLYVAVRNASVLDKMGVTWFGNAVGDISIPKMSNSTALWASEVTGSTDGAGVFSEVNLKPKRLTAYIDISKTFLAQDANSAESLIINDLARAISMKLDQTVFGAGTGDTYTPAGIFAQSAVTSGATDLSAITYENVIDLESKVEAKNGRNFIFVANPKVYYALKSTDRASGYGKMVAEDNMIDDVTCIRSNSVNDKSLLCVCPEDIVIGAWNFELTVDPTSQAINNVVRVVVNAYYDANLRDNRLAGEIFG